MERKTFSGSATWNCSNLPNYQLLTVNNFYGCTINGQIHIYGSWQPKFAITPTYNSSTGILTVQISQWDETGGSVSFYPNAQATIQPI